MPLPVHAPAEVRAYCGTMRERAVLGQPVGQWVDDLLLALAVALAEIGAASALAAHRQHRPIDAAGYALLAGGSAVLALRRRYVVPVLAATYVLTFAYLAVERHVGAVWLAVIVAVATAVAAGKRAAAIGFVAAGYVGFLWGPALLTGRHAPPAVFAVSLGCGLALLLGIAELARLRAQRAIALAEGREQEALRRAGEERLRMARELHDVVAHNIAVINVQAGTALHLMDREPERARSALEAINGVSKQALVELRSVLGVLRDVDEPESRAPAPSLARLDDLLANARASGLAVRFDEQGGRPRLPANVDLAAYRIVQEALTNSVRHAGGTRAHVRIVYGDGDVQIEVDDEGAALPARAGGGAGRGIVGMRERAHALGGTLRAGPRAGGGFAVRARLPYGGEPA